jgi:hypothetical protein
MKDTLTTPLITAPLIAAPLIAAALMAAALLMTSFNLYGEQAVAEKAKAQPTTIQTPDPVKKPEPQSIQKTEAIPTDTLGGTGLKSRKLSEVFEQFVPSESISADNAVPFPVDI